MEERRYSSWTLVRIAIGEIVRLRFGISTMGRHSSSTIRLVEATFISRHHAHFEIGDNDESVIIKDLSSNGIYINETKYDKATIRLKNNDVIGIGVSPANPPNDIDSTRLPIYQLKFSPIKKFQLPKDLNFTPSSSLSKLELKIDTSKSIKHNIKTEMDNKSDGNDQKTCISKSVKVENMSCLDDIIFEISDEEESVVVAKVEKNAINNETKAVDEQQQFLLDLNKQINEVIQNELVDDMEYINPSQKDQLAVIANEDDIKLFNEISNTETVYNGEKPSTSKKNILDNKERQEHIIHIPIMSNIKKERIRSVSADIQNIFGDSDEDDVVQQTIKQIDPLIYNAMHTSKKFLNDGDIINLTDDEDLEGAEVEDLGTLISNDTESEEILQIPNETIEKNVADTNKRPETPSIFDSSLINSNEKDNRNSTGQPELDVNKYMTFTDNEDEADVIFSQVIMNEMKDELQEDVNVLEPCIGNPENTIKIKQEPGLELFPAIPIELQNSCWIISDDEDYDKELETKVNDWSNKIYSQSVSQNMSQVYEIEDAYHRSDSEEEDDGCHNSSILEDDIEGIAAIYANELLDANNKFDSVDGQMNTNDVINNMPIKEEKLQVNKSTDIESQDIKVESMTNETVSNKEKHQNELHPEVNRSKDNNRQDNKVEIIGNEKVSNKEIHQNKLYPEVNKSNDNDGHDDKVESMSNENILNKEIHQNKLHPVKENSHILEKDKSSAPIDSPLIRLRRKSTTNPVTDPSSSSEDELYIKNNKLSNNKLVPEPDKLLTRLPPQVIPAPALPRYKGKLRGVSAELPKTTTTTTTLQPINVQNKKTVLSVKEKFQHERYNKDMKRKWIEKPNITKKRDREQKNLIKEIRKDKLKALAERKKVSPKENNKRKLPREDHQSKAKIPKVKVTLQNRGAFLANEVTTATVAPATAEQINQFKIPKIAKKSEEPKKPNSIQTKTKNAPTRSLSVDGIDTFSQQISKPDTLLLKRQQIAQSKKSDQSNQMNEVQKPAPLRRHSINDTFKQSILERKSTNPTASVAICKEAVAARAVRTTNKITFASMEKNIIESEENKRKLNQLNCAKATTLLQKKDLKSCSMKKKKTVRFNDTPIIHYIERVMGTSKTTACKDIMPMTTYKSRRQFVRSRYPIIDYTHQIISNILSWSNEWLIKRNASADAAADLIYPMPTYFDSFEHYKSIMFPLMKLEFVSILEREYNEMENIKNMKVSLDYASLNDDRIVLVTKYLNKQNNKGGDNCIHDLVILEPDKKGPLIFAILVGNRRSGTSDTIIYEIMAKNYTLEYFRAIKEFSVRRVMDKVRIHIGSFNSIYQLESTPLFQKIINPLEMLKCRPPPKKKVIYRGFDKLNDKQRQVLLSTYVKIIDELTPNISLIQGPPGTGKSCVITNLVLQTLYGEEVRFLDKKILICAQSNAAVDVIALKLYDISMRMRPEKRFRLIRYGMNRVNPKVMPIVLQKVIENDQLKKLQAKNTNIRLENKENLKNQIAQFEIQIADMSARNIKGTVEEDTLIEKKRQLQLMRNILNETMGPEDERSLFSWYLCNANVICATLSSCVNLSQYINFFDICIIDEATQCTEPWTLMPLKFGINSLVLVGDTQQLPATVLSKKAKELGLGTSIFTRIQQCLDNIQTTSNKDFKAAITTPNNIMHSLQTQYRMHPEICRWPNQYYYRNELINAPSIIELNKTPLVPFCILSLAYTQNNTCGNGKFTNNLEAEFVAKLLKALDGFIPNKYNSYGVITPYAHHCGTLESSIKSLGLTNIMVNTIDSYQGLEKDVIVISNARTSGIGFLSNPQRLNVALTRSKKCLILCGNFRNLESVPSWRCLLENARERKLYHEIPANSVEDIHRNVVEKIKLKNQNQ